MLKNNGIELNKTGALRTILAGKKAITEIEGLRKILLRGIVLNYLIFVFLTILLNIFFYFNFFKPIIEWIFGFGNEFWMTLGNLVLWSIQLSFAAIITLVSLRLSIGFLSFWNHSLVNKIIGYFRNDYKKKLPLESFLKEIVFFFIGAFRESLFPILLLVISLIPFIGLLIVFLIESHLLGKQCIVVYLENLNDLEENDLLKKRLRWLPVRMGWLPSLLTFIPLIGWILLPITLSYQVIGFAYNAELIRNS